MNRIVAIALIALLAACSSAGEPSKPNILFIFTDDHSLQTIGAYNHRLSAFCREHKITPNIDRLAAEGALFTQSFCGNSLCSPSRASILTGLHSHANGVMNLEEKIRDEVWQFPPALQAAGYQTALFGKWHIASQPKGFDTFRILPGQGAYWNPVFIKPGQERETVPGYCTDIITQKSLEWLKSRDTNKPFLLLCHHKAPHRNWQPPTRYYRFLADVKVPEPETLFDDYAGRGSAARNQKMQVGRDMVLGGDLKVLAEDKIPKGRGEAEHAEWLATYGKRNEAFHAADLKGRELTQWKYQEYMRDYLRCIKAVDDGIGELLDYLDKNDLAKNTIVIYASDQGFYNGEHGWFDKRFIYEESLRMPLIIRWPGVVKAGARPAQFVQNIDYAPTFIEIAGAEQPKNIHGRSLVPILKGETPAGWRKSVYYHYYAPDSHAVAKHYGIRTERYTLAHFYQLNEWEMYDLEKDPQQMRNVFSDPAHTAALTEVKAELQKLKDGFNDRSDTELIPAKP